MPPNAGQGLILARFLFNSREQEESESIDEFVGSLTKLSSKCKYETTSTKVEYLVRDRFIVGIRNKEIQSKLLKCADDLSLDCAIEIVKSSGKDIKLEHEDDDLPISLHDKLQVQVDVLPPKPDIKVSEEAKIAILIELMNHKSILNAPCGHEEEKAELWDKVFHFAKSSGAPFKSALHLREVFGTWKSWAIQSKQQLRDDVKMSNADKLIWDLFGQDTFEDYPNLQSILNDSANALDFEQYGHHDDDEMYHFEEDDLNSSSSEEEPSDGDEFEPAAKRRPGRPRKGSPNRGTSIVMSAELKIMVLKKLLQQKDIITAQGNEREKKNVWRNLFEFLENKLNVGSPSVLRNAFRLWKQRSLKKRFQPGETITESDKLIYKIFNVAESSNQVDPDEQAASEGLAEDEEPSEEEGEEDVGKSFIDRSLRLKILHELAKHRRKIMMNVGTVYEIEASWRDIHEKVQKDFGLKHLTMKKVKELLQFWQSWALHDAVRQGGPVTRVQKLAYFVNNIPKNAAAPYASMKDGVPPVLISRVPGCIHITPQARIAILKELISSKNDPDKWAKAVNVALKHHIQGATEGKLRFAVKQWKAKTLEKHMLGCKPKTKTEKLTFELCDLNDAVALDNDCDDQVIATVAINETARMAVVAKVAENPFILCRKSKQAARKRFWTDASEIAHVETSVKALKASFWHWPSLNSSAAEQRLSKVLDILRNIHAVNRQISDDVKASVVNQVFQNQQILLLGTSEEKLQFWNQLLKSLGNVGMHDGLQLSMSFTLWKETILTKIEKGVSLKPFEHMILQVCIGHLSNFDLSQSAKGFILPWLRDERWKNNWMEIHSKTVAQHGIQDPMILYKAVKRWKLNALKKEEYGHSLREDEVELLKTVDVEDWLEADLLARSEDTSKYDASANIVVPNAVKSDIVTLISTKQDSVYGSNMREMNSFWSETLDSLVSQRNVVCDQATDLQRAYFAWTLEAWQKKLVNAYLLPYEEVMLDLIASKNRIEHQFNWDGEGHEDVDALEIPEKAMAKLVSFLIEYKDLQSRDKCLFWTLGLRFVQSYCSCDNSPVRLYATILKEKLISQQSSFGDVPLTDLQRDILVLFGNDSTDDNGSSLEEDDEGDDVCEEENFWDKLTDEVSDKARMAILEVLYEHRDIIASRKMQKRDHDRTAVWQKALNVAIEEGVKIENHGKLTRMVTDWREKAKRHEIEGRKLSHWERYLLSIFEEENNIKEELEDNEDELHSAISQSHEVEDSVKLAIIKAMMRHRQLLKGNSDQQASGWRKVHRIAQANGSFYESVGPMQSSISNWKNRALAKLSKYPMAICEVDKLLFSYYEVDIGQLDLDQIHHQYDGPLKVELPTATGLSIEGKMAILQEMNRNKAAIAETDHWPSHKDRFFAWSSVLQVANSMGGSFPSIASLTTYVWHHLKMPTLQKIQASSAINEMDVLVAKVYDLDTERLELQAEFNLSVPTQHACQFCQLQFSRFDEMKLHQQMAHGQVPENDISRKCRICGSDTGVDKPAIRAHFRNYHVEEPFQCDYCDQMHLNDAGYYDHAKTHLTYNPLETIEALLETTEDNQGSPPVAKHQRKRGIYRKRVKIELPPPECEEVPKIGKKEGGLCPHCGEYYKHVQQHIMYKHETKKPWKCDQCDYAHALQKGLQEHVRNCHPKESDLKVCHICGYKTTLNHNLKEHIERTHEKKRRFTCNLCDAHFYRKNVMERHVRVDHMGERPHKCSTCGETFKHLIVLKRHIKVVHLKIKETCALCGNQYTDRKSLNKHQRIHHPEAWAQRPKGRPKR